MESKTNKSNFTRKEIEAELAKLKGTSNNKESSNWEISIQNFAEKAYKDIIKAETDKDKKKEDPLESLLSVLLEHLTFGLISRKFWGDDGDKLKIIRIYNPEKASWENPLFIFGLILYSTGKKYTPIDITKMANVVFERIRNSRGTFTLPNGYSGSRYLLYENGIFDLKTMKLHAIKLQSDPSGISNYDPNQLFEVNGELVNVPAMGMTLKHKHMRELVIDPEMPVFKATAPHKTWTPLEWLLRTNGGKEDQANYFLQLLGIMLVPNHSFNCFIEINGQPSSGKTTLVSFAKQIYGDNGSINLNYTLSDLNNNFPFRGTVDESTNLIQITEVNGAGLTANAIALINNMANKENKMIQMGTKSVTLDPPPLLVMEGKGWALFDNTKTGIKRRLLPLDLSEADTADYKTPELKKQVFQDKRVVDWFNWQALLALHDLTKGNENFIFEIDDPKTLPPFARRWHLMAVNAGDEYMQHFIERIKPALHSGYLPIPLMHQLYSNSVRLENEDAYIRPMESFKDALLVYLKEEYDVKDFGQTMQKFDEEDLGIDFSELKNMMELPNDAVNYGMSAYAKFAMPNWIQIKKQIEANTEE